MTRRRPGRFDGVADCLHCLARCINARARALPGWASSYGRGLNGPERRSSDGWRSAHAIGKPGRVAFSERHQALCLLQSKGAWRMRRYGRNGDQRVAPNDQSENVDGWKFIAPGVDSRPKNERPPSTR